VEPRESESVDSRPVVVFVGSFHPAARDGCLGGQLYACQALVQSPLQHSVRWVLIDSTQRSLPAPSFPVRVAFALRRLTKFTRATAKPTRCVLLFSPYLLSSVMEKGVMCAIARMRSIRVVWSIRSEIRANSRLKALLMCRMLRRANILLCQTETAARKLDEALGSPEKNIRSIPNWIDCASYRVKTSIPEIITFLFMGWYEPEKGIRELIAAAEELAREGIRFRLITAGGGSRIEWMKNQARERGLERHVSIYAWVSGGTKTALLAAADVLVLPSYTEGLPNSVLEGMASGMAVIASPVGGIPTLMEPDVNGLLAPAGDAGALAAAMKRLAANPRLVREMGKRNAEKVRNQYDISLVTPIFADLLGAPAVEREAASHLAL
jgi:glycosyltransferase involved in cell wall biosynthesis